MFIAALFTKAKIWKQPKCPLTDKEDVVYIHKGILFSHKKNDILPFVTTWMDLEGIMLSEISQTEKDTHGIFSLNVESTKRNKRTNMTD